MRELKLLRILEVLEAKEFRRFRQYMESDFPNRNTKLVALLDFIAAFHPTFDENTFTEERAFVYIFPQAEYKQGTVVKLVSKLFACLSDFFAVNRVLAGRFEKDIALLNEFSDREFTHDFDLLSKKIRDNYSLEENLSTLDFYNRYQLERVVNQMHSTRKDKGVGDVHFKDVNNALDIYYLYSKLIYTCQEINRGKVVKGLNISDFDQSIVEMIPDTMYIEEPIIDIWYSAYMLLSRDDKWLNYNNLKQKLFENSHIPNISQLRMLFTYLENVAIRIFKTRQELYEELFELYQFQNDNKALLDNKAFIPAILKNYMTVTLNLGKVDEAQAFLESCKERVMKIHPNSFMFCWSMLLFRQKRYDEALETLNELNFKNIIMKINERTLRLKLYYHLRYYDLLYDSINSFRVFLTNNKDIISDRILEANRNFSGYLFQIIKKGSLASFDTDKLAKNIKSDIKTTEKNWLLEQVDNAS